MKTLISTLALAFTGPAFAGDVTKATDKASCDQAGGTWDAQTNKCTEKKMLQNCLSRGRRISTPAPSSIDPWSLAPGRRFSENQY